MQDILAFFSSETIHDFYNLLILAGIVIVVFFVSFLLFKLVSVLVRRISGSSYELIHKRLSLPFRLLITVISLNIAQGFTYFQSLNNFYVNKIMFILLIMALAMLLVKITEFIRDGLYERFDIMAANNLSERKIRTQIDFIQKVSSVLIIFLAISVILMSFTRVRELGTSLIASAGIASVIIGFAAQKSIANLLAGLQIAFTQPIRYDDVVIVENEWGRVEEITLTYVVIRIWDSRRLIVPISYFLEKPFQNWTRSSADLLGTVFLNTDFSLPVEAIRAELNNILADPDVKKLWDGRTSVVQVTDATENTMQVRILVSAANSGNAFDLRCIIRERIIAYILKNYPTALPKHRLDNTVTMPQVSKPEPQVKPAAPQSPAP
jgi:small-conductance mechanosensitive channel